MRTTRWPSTASGWDWWQLRSPRAVMWASTVRAISVVRDGALVSGQVTDRLVRHTSAAARIQGLS